MAAAISVIVGAAAVFAYLETMAHVRHIKDNQQPSFHSIYQLREHQLRLIRALNEYLHEPGRIDHPELMRRFDVLWSRVGPLLSLETAALLGDLEDDRDHVARIQELLDQIDPLVQDLLPGDHATTALITGQLDQMFEPYEALRRNMQGNAGIRSDSLVSEAKRYGYIQIALLSISLTTGGILCFLVFRHARRAHLLASRDPLTGLLNRSQLGTALSCSDKRPGEEKPVNMVVHLIEKIGQHGHIAGVLVRKIGGDNVAIGQINSKMQLPPRSARISCLFVAETLLAPFTRAIDLQPGAVDHKIQAVLS